MKRFIALLMAALLAVLCCAALAKAEKAEGGDVQGQKVSGTVSASNTSYTATFTTDHSMFHVNEEYDDKGTLTVKDGEMTIHVSLVSKNIVNLFFGLAEDAQKDGAVLLEPTEDEIAYSDGTTGVVYGFDIPVPVLCEEYDVALLGKKGKWYDHKVMVSDPVPAEEQE